MLRRDFPSYVIPTQSCALEESPQTIAARLSKPSFDFGLNRPVLAPTLMLSVPISFPPRVCNLTNLHRRSFGDCRLVVTIE